MPPRTGRRFRLLILGGGVYQVPLIRRARELDLETIVVTPAGPYPGIGLGDHHWNLNTTDDEAVLDAARSYGIDAVATTGTDVCLPTLGRIVDELGLPGPSGSSARISADKTLMKRAFKEHGVPTADFEIVGSLADARRASRRLGFPLIVKASDSSGSRGVTRVDSASTLEAAWSRAWAVSRNRLIVVERCLEGVEFGAQAFVTGDEVVAVFAHNDTDRHRSRFSARWFVARFARWGFATPCATWT
jgi:biotin carboxylase